MSVSMLFRETCPLVYQPSGFLDADKSQASLWQDRNDSLRATKFETGTRSVSIRLQRHVNDLEQDSKLSKQIWELQQTSSRDHKLPPTLNTVTCSKKRKRTTEDQARSSRSEASRTRSFPGGWPDYQSVEVVDLGEESKDVVKRKNHQKISISEKLVQFSSSSHIAMTSDIGSEQLG